MKHPLTAALLILALASCTKEDPKPPEIVYNVKCLDCIVYYEDNVNSSIETYGNLPNRVNVKGDWRYSFPNTTNLTTVTLYVATEKEQAVVVNVAYQGKLAGFGKMMSKEGKAVTLKLN